VAANYLAENDKLLELGTILRGESRKLPERAHVDALVQLVRTAESLLARDYPYAGSAANAVGDWLREASKVL